MYPLLISLSSAQLVSVGAPQTAVNSSKYKEQILLKELTSEESGFLQRGNRLLFSLYCDFGIQTYTADSMAKQRDVWWKAVCRKGKFECAKPTESLVAFQTSGLSQLLSDEQPHMVGDIIWEHRRSGTKWRLHSNVFRLYGKTDPLEALKALSSVNVQSKSIAAFFVCLYGGNVQEETESMAAARQMMEIFVCFEKLGLEEHVNHLKHRLFVECLVIGHENVKNLFSLLDEALQLCEERDGEILRSVAAALKVMPSVMSDAPFSMNGDSVELWMQYLEEGEKNFSNILAIMQLVASSAIPNDNANLSAPTEFPAILEKVVSQDMPVPRKYGALDPPVPLLRNQFFFCLPSERVYVSVLPEVLYCYWPYFVRMVSAELDETTSRVCTLPLDFPLNVFMDMLQCIYMPTQRQFKTTGEAEALYALEHGAEYSLFSGLSPDAPAPIFTGFVRHCIRILFPPATTQNAGVQLERVRRIGNWPAKEKELSFLVRSGETSSIGNRLYEKLKEALKGTRTQKN